MKLLFINNGDVIGVGKSLKELIPNLIAFNNENDLGLSESFLDHIKLMDEDGLAARLQEGTFQIVDCDESLKILFDSGELDSLANREDIYITADSILTADKTKDRRPSPVYGEYPMVGRAEEFAQHWDDLKEYARDTLADTIDVQAEINEANGWDERPDFIKMNDAIMTMYLKQTEPLWEINTVSQDAALLIEKSRLDHVSITWKPLLLRAEKGCTLFGLVNEICVILDGDQWYLSYTERMAGDLLMSSGTAIFGDEQDNTLWQMAESKHQKAVSYAKKFLALKDCEKSPLMIQSSTQQNAERKGIRMVGGVVRLQVSLSKRYQSTQTQGKGIPVSKDGKTLAVVEVSGFIREQAYGPGRTQRKAIWVDGFQRGQWVHKGTRMITIKE